MTPDRSGTADATPGGEAHPSADAADGPTPPASGPLGRITRLVERVLRWGPVPGIRFVFDAYGNAGGGILASGLAFGAIFALIPATLLVIGVAGFIIADQEIRNELVLRLAALVPPLEDFIILALDQIAAGAVAYSIIGLIGFAWTASQFYGQLDHAFALVFHSPIRRDPIERTIRGLIAVGLVIALFVALLWISIFVTTTPSEIVDAAQRILRLLSPLLGLGIVAALVALMYRIVPTERPALGAVIVPAFVVAVLEGLLTTLFVIIAPYLASPAVFGPFFTVFATLAWLSWSFQLVLLGAAWCRARAFGIDATP